MASGMKIPVNKPYGLNYSPGLRQIGKLAANRVERLRVDWRRGVTSQPHCAARQRRDFISQGMGRHPQKCKVCQNCARDLQVWTFWRIW